MSIIEMTPVKTASDLYEELRSASHQYIRQHGCRRTPIDGFLDHIFQNKPYWVERPEGMRKALKAVHTRSSAQAIDQLNRLALPVFNHLEILEDDVSSLRNAGHEVALDEYVQLAFPGLIQKLRHAVFNEEMEVRGDVLALLNTRGYEVGYDRVSRKLTIVTRVGRMILRQ